MPHKYTTEFAQRFRSNVKVVPFGCHEWQLSTYRNGYGQTAIGRKKLLAHRVAWELANGDIPDETLVCHKCDNRKCCNPDHLFLGTTQDNINDKSSKGRTPKGESHSMAKVTEHDVRSIRALYGNKFKQETIAERFGLSQTQVWRICSGKRWAHIK